MYCGVCNNVEVKWHDNNGIKARGSEVEVTVVRFYAASEPV